MTLRIAHLIAPGSSGGAESVARALAVGRAARGLPTRVFAASTDGAGAFLDALREGGVPVDHFPRRGRHYVSEVREVTALLERHRIDVLHTHVYWSDFIGFFAARRVGTATVSTFHGECGGDWMNRLYEWGMKRLFRRFDRVICVSRNNLRLLAASGASTAHAVVVPNGIGPVALLARGAARAALGVADARTPLVGWIGRLSAEKGPDLLLAALRRVPVPVTAVVIGDGPGRHDLERAARATGVDVRFVGAIPNAARLLRAFDVLAMSSRREGLPIVLLEAFSARVPVVAFAVGGIPELLTTATGWPVPPLDVAALATALATAVAEGASAGDRSAAAFQLVSKDYGLNTWLDRVEAVYRTAHSPPGSAG